METTDELAEKAGEAFAAMQDKKVMKKLKIRKFSNPKAEHYIFALTNKQMLSFRLYPCGQDRRLPPCDGLQPFIR